MPELNYGATFLESNVDTIVPQSWENDVLPPFQKIRTLLNTTGLDYQNVQDNGIRYTGIRTHDAIEAVRYKVRNNTGGSLAKGDLVYFTGTYSDGTDSYPTVAKAISTTAAATNFFAQGVCTAAISDSADGTVAVFLELTNINTSGGTVGDPVYLNTSAGGWTRTRPTGGQYVQVVGTISVVHASTGRVIFSLGALPEFLKGGSSGLDAELETLTLTDALILGDDKAVHFGASTDYSIQYDSGNTQWELVSTNIDGSGTNGVVLLVEDGTNDVSLAGGLSTDALSTPTAGLTTTAVTAVSLDISGDVDVDGTLEADAITLGGTALGSLYSPIAGSSSIVTVGTIGTGTWGATDVAVAHGGTGASSAADARTNLGLVIGTNVQAYDAGLNSIAGLTTAANKMIYTSGSDTYAVADLSAFARSILDDADAAAVRTTIGAQASGSYQASDAGLTSIAGLTTAADKMIYTSDSDTYAVTGLTSFARSILDDADAAAVRTTIGAQASGTYSTLAFKTISVSGQDDVVADAADDTLTLAAGSNITITTTAGSDTVTIAGSAGGIASVVADTSPQLGGDLDVNGQSIVSDGSNENIPITPHGTGSVAISKIDVAAGEIDGTAIGANSASTGAFTTLAASGTTTLSGDQVITDGNGLISGHTARVQVGWATGENQILGTADADANLSITRFSADNGPPNLFFGKSRGGLGTVTSIVADGDPLGRITFCGSDGTDLRSAGAWIEAECDGAFEDNNIAGRIIFATTPDSSGIQDPVERMRITSAGLVYIGDANAAGNYGNANMTQGLTINQEANDNEILAFKSSDIAHGVTNTTQTDTWACFKKGDANSGGLFVHGLTEGSEGISFYATATTEVTSDTTGSAANTISYSATKAGGGTSATGMSSTANLFAIRNAGTTRVIIKGDGTVHASDTSWATDLASDDMPDALAGRAYRTEMANRHSDGLIAGMEIHAPELVARMEEKGIITPAEKEGEGTIPGHRFLNVQQGIKFSWDMGFQNFVWMYEMAKVLSDEQRAALPDDMQSAFAALEANESQFLQEKN